MVSNWRPLRISIRFPSIRGAFQSTWMPPKNISVHFPVLTTFSHHQKLTRGLEAAGCGKDWWAARRFFAEVPPWDSKHVHMGGGNGLGMVPETGESCYIDYEAVFRPPVQCCFLLLKLLSTFPFKP